MCLPDGSALLSALVDHFPPEAVVVALATSVAPSNTCTTTSVFSLAVARERRRRVVRRRRRPDDRHDRRFGVDFEGTVAALRRPAFPMPALLGRLRRERVFAGRQRFARACSSTISRPTPSFSRSRLRSRLRTRARRLRCFRSPSPENDGVVSFDGDRRPLRSSRPAASCRLRRRLSPLSPSAFPRPLFSVANAVSCVCPHASALLERRRPFAARRRRCRRSPLPWRLRSTCTTTSRVFARRPRERRRRVLRRRRRPGRSSRRRFGVDFEAHRSALRRPRSRARSSPSPSP